MPSKNKLRRQRQSHLLRHHSSLSSKENISPVNDSLATDTSVFSSPSSDGVTPRFGLTLKRQNMSSSLSPISAKRSPTDSSSSMFSSLFQIRWLFSSFLQFQFDCLVSMDHQTRHLPQHLRFLVSLSRLVKHHLYVVLQASLTVVLLSKNFARSVYLSKRPNHSIFIKWSISNLFWMWWNTWSAHHVIKCGMVPCP